MRTPFRKTPRMSAWIARLLARWANTINVRARLDAEGDLKAERAIVKQKDSEIALLKAEVEFLAAWRDRELARLRREADIARAASVLSTEMPERE